MAKLACPCCPKTSGSTIRVVNGNLVECTRKHKFHDVTKDGKRFLVVAVEPPDQGGCHKGDEKEIPLDTQF